MHGCGTGLSNTMLPQGSHSFDRLKFRDFFHDLFLTIFSSDLGVTVHDRN